MHLPPPNPTTHRRAGFTLLEFVAVLSILTLVASVVTVNVVERLKRTARDSEALSMETMVSALRTNILRTRRVPAIQDWPQLIARELAVDVTRVQKTRVGFTRSFLADPNLDLGAPGAFNRSLPYSQSAAGTTDPLNPRVAFVSSLGASLPEIPQDAATFNEIWSTAAQSIPDSWEDWEAGGADLTIERLDLRGLFHRVIFNNLDPDHAAPYSIDALTNLVSIPSGQRVEAFFVRTSAINLHYPNQSLQASEFLLADVSYVFENGRWSRYLNYGIRPPLTGFGLLAEKFRTSQANSEAKFGANQQAVIEEIFTYLYTYGIWATGNPPYMPPFSTGGSSSDQQVPSYQVLLDAQKRLEIISKNLIDY